MNLKILKEVFALSDMPVIFSILEAEGESGSGSSVLSDRSLAILQQSWETAN